MPGFNFLNCDLQHSIAFPAFCFSLPESGIDPSASLRCLFFHLIALWSIPVWSCCLCPSRPRTACLHVGIEAELVLAVSGASRAGWWSQSSVPAYLQIQSRPSQRPTSFNNNKDSAEGEQTVEFASGALLFRNWTTWRQSGVRLSSSTPYLRLRIIRHRDAASHPSVRTNFSGVFCHVLTNNGYESVQQPQPLLLFTFLLAAIIPPPRRTRLAICRLSLV